MGPGARRPGEFPRGQPARRTRWAIPASGNSTTWPAATAPADAGRRPPCWRTGIAAVAAGAGNRRRSKRPPAAPEASRRGRPGGCPRPGPHRRPEPLLGQRPATMAATSPRRPGPSSKLDRRAARPPDAGPAPVLRPRGSRTGACGTARIPGSTTRGSTSGGAIAARPPRPAALPARSGGPEPPRIARGAAGWSWRAGSRGPRTRLTARVMVNRIWQHHFGEGIVRTPSNFGRKGEPPSHPELLDWLARRFVESGWSIKAMHRLIMLSAAYQQSSQAAAALREPTRRTGSSAGWTAAGSRRRRSATACSPSPAGWTTGRAARPNPTPPARAGCSTWTTPLGPLVFRAAVRRRRPAMRRAPDRLDRRPPGPLPAEPPLVLAQARGLARRPEVAAAADPARRIAGLTACSSAGRRPPRRSRWAAASSPTRRPGTDAEAAWDLYAQALLLTNEFLFVDDDGLGCGRPPRILVRSPQRRGPAMMPLTGPDSPGYQPPPDARHGRQRLRHARPGGPAGRGPGRRAVARRDPRPIRWPSGRRTTRPGPSG